MLNYCAGRSIISALWTSVYAALECDSSTWKLTLNELAELRCPSIKPLINSRGPCALEPVSATQHSVGDSIQKPSEFNRIGIAKLIIRPIITIYLQHFWNPFNELIRMQSLLSRKR
ncbi:hypothetical protein DTO271G3_8661 [Paecilomyces variotii]|nr:hypothetical protein DTO271G3_8661 [Paecilomyces variotii]